MEAQWWREDGPECEACDFHEDIGYGFLESEFCNAYFRVRISDILCHALGVGGSGGAVRRGVFKIGHISITKYVEGL